MNRKSGIRQKCNYVLCNSFNHLEEETWQHEVIEIVIPSALVCLLEVRIVGITTLQTFKQTNYNPALEHYHGDAPGSDLSRIKIY